MDRSLLRSLGRRMSALGKGRVLAAALVAVSVVGLIDLVVSAEISFMIFYVLPVSAAAFYAGMGAGIAVAVVSAGIWLFADLVGGALYSAPLIPYWNCLVRLGSFLIIARLISLLRKRLAIEENLADTDSLTGLPNARAFLEALEAEHGRAARYGHPFTLAYVDLDDFKGVNDALGHAPGDRVLQAAARALKSGVRRTDVVGRLGGDEFAVLLPESNAAAAKPVLAKIREAVVAAMRQGGWPVGASVGAVTFEGAPSSAKAALKAADDLMFEAKRSGKNRLVHHVAGASDGPPASARRASTQADR